jgi:hypothetical protein
MELAFDKDEDMQKPFISKTKYDKIVKGDKEETKHKKSFILYFK